MSIESPFVTTSRIINEPTNAFDDLRIIATSGERLDRPTRAIIANAADELEATQKLLLATQVKLIEVQGRLIAVNDQMLVLRRAGHPTIIPITAMFGSTRLQGK